MLRSLRQNAVDHENQTCPDLRSSGLALVIGCVVARPNLAVTHGFDTRLIVSREAGSYGCARREVGQLMATTHNMEEK